MAGALPGQPSDLGRRRRCHLNAAVVIAVAGAAGAAAAAAVAAATAAAAFLRPLCSAVPLAVRERPSAVAAAAASRGSGARRARCPARGTGAPPAKRPRPQRPLRRGFSMPKVSDEPPVGYDTGPKELSIMRYPHPALRRPNAAVEKFDEKLRQLAENLFRAMYKEDDPPGIGLAAPQVGVNLRVMVYNAKRTETQLNRDGEEVFVNPRITASGDEKEEMFEACLSFPQMEGPVVRPAWIEVEAWDLEGRPYTRRIEGDEARVFQHEYDHLDGVLYIDRLEEDNRRAVQKTLDRLVDEYSAGGGKQPAL